MRQLTLLFLIALAFAPMAASAQSVTMGSLPTDRFCEGDSVLVPFTASGSFTARNSFTLQLSAPDGNFDKFFYNLGSIRTPNSGVVGGLVPAYLTSSTGYRVRIISSEPYSESAPWGPVRASGRPGASFEYSVQSYDWAYAFVGDTIRFKVNSPSADQVLWEFGADAIPQSSTERNPSVWFSRVGEKTIKLTTFSVAGCETINTFGPNVVNSREHLYIVSCDAAIPNDAVVDSVGVGEVPGTSFWVVPGGQANTKGNGTQYFGEAGSTIKGNMFGGSIVYLKAGAAYFGGMSGSAVLYEEGAGLANVEQERLFKCTNIEFDYRDAPPYKITWSSVARIAGSSISTYPNPTSDRLTIEHNDLPIREIIIRNTLGTEQLFMHPEGLGKTTVDVSGLAAGLYFLDLITDRGIETHKIVVTR